MNGWKKDSPQTITVTVEESNRGGSVKDRMSMAGGRGSDEQSFQGAPQAAERPLGSDVRVIELLPYAQSLLQGGLKPGQENAFPNAVLVGGQTYRIRRRSSVRRRSRFRREHSTPCELILSARMSNT